MTNESTEKYKLVEHEFLGCYYVKIRKSEPTVTGKDILPPTLQIFQISASLFLLPKEAAAIEGLRIRDAILSQTPSQLEVQKVIHREQEKMFLELWKRPQTVSSYGVFKNPFLQKLNPSFGDIHSFFPHKGYSLRGGERFKSYGVFVAAEEISLKEVIKNGLVWLFDFRTPRPFLVIFAVSLGISIGIANYYSKKEGGKQKSYAEFYLVMLQDFSRKVQGIQDLFQAELYENRQAVAEKLKCEFELQNLKNQLELEKKKPTAFPETKTTQKEIPKDNLQNGFKPKNVDTEALKKQTQEKSSTNDEKTELSCTWTEEKDKMGCSGTW